MTGGLEGAAWEREREREWVGYEARRDDWDDDDDDDIRALGFGHCILSAIYQQQFHLSRLALAYASLPWGFCSFGFMGIPLVSDRLSNSSNTTGVVFSHTPVPCAPRSQRDMQN